LDLIRHLQIEHHLAECTECAERERSLRLLRDTIASAALYHRAPDALRARLQTTHAPPPAMPASRHRRRPSVLLAATAAGIAVLVAAATAGISSPGPGPPRTD